MPTTPCQKCGKFIDFTDKQAGKSLPCPYCGVSNIMPGGDPAAAPVLDKAASKGLPSPNGPEVEVMIVRQAMFGAKPFSFLVLWIAVIGGALGAVFFSLIAAPVSLPIAGVCGGIALLCLGTLMVWRIARHAKRLEITTKRIIYHQGLISRRVNEVRIQDIRDMQIIQSFSERVFGIGQLSISTAGQSDYEIEIADIPRPNKIREIIDVYRGI